MVCVKLQNCLNAKVHFIFKIEPHKTIKKSKKPHWV